MNNLSIDVSPKQLSRLRNGHRVRIKKGTGFNLLVKPDTYNIATRAFIKDKALEIQLSPEEIQYNKEQAPEMEGQGIFGKKFDKMLKKAGIKKLAYKAGDAVKPMIKEGIEAGLAALGPEAAIAGAPLKEMLFGIMDNPSEYGLGDGKADKKKLFGKAGRAYGNMANQYATEQLGFDPREAYQTYQSMSSNPYASNQGSFTTGLRDYARQGAMDWLASQDGSNVGYMGRAGYGTADANIGSDYWSQLAHQRQMSGAPSGMWGNGLVQDMRRGLNRGVSKTRGFVGLGINPEGGYIPQALMSQPFSTNFHMQNMLPPDYRKFHDGGESVGQGLFAGRGLFV